MEDFKMYDEGITIFSQKWVKARNDYECTYCGRHTIIKGDEYYAVRALNPNTEKPDTEKFCYHCIAEMREPDAITERSDKDPITYGGTHLCSHCGKMVDNSGHDCKEKKQ